MLSRQQCEKPAPPWRISVKKRKPVTLAKQIEAVMIAKAVFVLRGQDALATKLGAVERTLKRLLVTRRDRP